MAVGGGRGLGEWGWRNLGRPKGGEINWEGGRLGGLRPYARGAPRPYTQDAGSERGKGNFAGRMTPHRHHKKAPLLTAIRDGHTIIRVCKWLLRSAL